MALELLAIDVGKRSFHLYGIDTDGMIRPEVTKRFSDTHKRTKVERRPDDGDQPRAF